MQLFVQWGIRLKFVVHVDGFFEQDERTDNTADPIKVNHRVLVAVQTTTLIANHYTFPALCN